MNRYHFSFGNSCDGPIGFCAEIAAMSESEAVEKLKTALYEDERIGAQTAPGVVYIRAYINHDHISEEDIFETWGDE